jgi:hypothetical protein
VVFVGRRIPERTKTGKYQREYAQLGLVSTLSSASRILGDVRIVASSGGTSPVQTRTGGAGVASGKSPNSQVLAGREHELARIDALLDDAAAGRSGARAGSQRTSKPYRVCAKRKGSTPRRR